DAALDTSRLPRISGAKQVYASALTTIFTSPDPVIATAGTIDKALATAGWQKYGAPFAATVDDPNMRMLSFKKGQQALGVFITLAPAQNNATSVQYNAVPLKNDLPFTNDASDIVYAPDRPTLSLVTAEPINKTLDFYRKELAVRGWSLWSRKLNAKEAADGPSGVAQERGAYAHYVSEAKPKVALVLTLQAADGGKFKVELKEWPIGILAPEEAKPVAGAPLEAGPELARLPVPKGRIGGTGSTNSSERSMTANIDADVDTVLAFYRRELTARNWKEESQGTAIAADRATVAFSTEDGTAVLRLGRESDQTSISLVQKIVKPPVARDESIDAIMKQALQMATQAEALSRSPSTRTPPPANEPAETLQALAGNDGPVPLPDTAADVEQGDGKLEFNSTSAVKSVADFYRSTMKQQGWQARSSVINNANMVVLDFTKARKTVSFTIMRMGAKTNVSARGSALEAAVKPADAVTASNAPVAEEPAPASAEDLEPEDNGGWPVPKRHTMVANEKSPFRRELTSDVPLRLADVLGFYRKELAKLGWTEDSSKAVVAQNNAALVFNTTEGQAALKLTYKNGATSVSLATRSPDALAKSQMAPKPGQAKLALVNPNETEVTVTINKKTIKVAPGVGTKAPDGPSLDLPPGKYRFSVKQAGKSYSDEIAVGAGEVWGLMFGPGGALPMKVY
ncbi:MAG: hypothetical protein JWO28_2489, partial [Hyphomicrobiales bacterium]|nr:hypothetical protein [Hyphomicrobiales bacterium]